MFPDNFFGHKPLRLIIGLAGGPGTGKSEVAKHLKDTMGFTVFEGSEYIKSTATAQGITLQTRQDYDEFHRKKQQEFGLTWLSDTALAIDAQRIVFSGLRTRPNALKLRSAGGFIIALQCPPEVCISRMDPKNPKNAKTVEEYVQQLHEQESKTDLGAHALWVAEHADYTVDAARPLEVVTKQVEALVRSLELPG